MRRILLLVYLVTLQFFVHAQVPYAFNYQAIVRNADGSIRSNTGILFVFKIIDQLDNVKYTESHSVVTNEYGLASVQVGRGATLDNFSSIDWGSGAYFLSVSINGEEVGSSQLMSVPYALYSFKAANGVPGPQGIQGPVGPQGVSGPTGPGGPAGGPHGTR